MDKIIRETIWHVNPMSIQKSKYELKLADLREKIMFLKYIRQQCWIQDLRIQDLRNKSYKRK